MSCDKSRVSEQVTIANVRGLAVFLGVAAFSEVAGAVAVAGVAGVAQLAELVVFSDMLDPFGLNINSGFFNA